MKKYIFTLLSAACIGFTSCSENTMDDININNEDPAPEKVPAKLQLTDAIMSTGFSTVSGDFAFYTSSLTEQNCGTGNNQLAKAELRNSIEWAASTTFNNVWDGTYGNLLNIRQIIEKIETEVPGNEGQFDVLGMAQVLEAVNFGVMTDMMGDIPYSEALQGQANMQPKLDAQKDIYTGLIATLDKAIENLTKGQNLKNASSQDIAYKGDAKKWLAAAYALKARYLIHQLAVNPSVLADAKAAAQKAADLNFSSFCVNGFTGDNSFDNPWSAFQWSRGYIASSKTVADLMTTYNDPRLYGYTHTFGVEKGAYVIYDFKAHAPGDKAKAEESWSDGNAAWYDLGNQPIHIMSKAELYFILAEAQLRSGEDATAAFQKAVASSVNEVMGYMEEIYNATGLTDFLTSSQSDVDAYVASLGTPDLKKVFEQKYLAQCIDEQVETYNDIRRLQAMGESYITLTNPMNTQSGINRFPYRLPYGNSAVLGNPNVAKAFGDGFYIYTEKTWINGGK